MPEVSGVDFIIQIGNEKQTITDASGGGTDTFKLAFISGGKTGTILETATAADVQTALEAIADFDSGDVTVTGASGGPWTVEFQGQYAGQDVQLLVASDETGTLVVTIAAGTTEFNTVAGQRGASMPRTMDEIDSTNKDSSGWHEGIPSIRNWSLEFDNLIIENGEALEALEAAYITVRKVHVRMQTPAGHTYTGIATLTEFNWSGPHDDVFAATGSLKGSGDLTKAT